MRFGALSLLVATLFAQSSQPTFRTRVDLLRVDVTVVDDSGAPIRDLGAGDFLVKVDGQPRTVSFARFYGPEAEQPAAGVDAAPASFADNTTTATHGRIVILVADLESMTPGYEKVFFEAAGSLIDRLGPEDSVGLILVPGKGIELTRDHARVRQVLADARGSASMRIGSMRSPCARRRRSSAAINASSGRSSTANAGRTTGCARGISTARRARS